MSCESVAVTGHLTKLTPWPRSVARHLQVNLVESLALIMEEGNSSLHLRTNLFLLINTWCFLDEMDVLCRHYFSTWQHSSSAQYNKASAKQLSSDSEILPAC